MKSLLHLIPTPTIYQDSASLVALVTQGDGVTRTRHLCNRMHLVKEVVEMKRIIIKPCKANSMITDGFTKPLEGIEFQQFLQSLVIFNASKRKPMSVE